MTDESVFNGVDSQILFGIYDYSFLTIGFRDLLRGKVAPHIYPEQDFRKLCL